MEALKALPCSAKPCLCSAMPCPAILCPALGDGLPSLDVKVLLTMTKSINEPVEWRPSSTHEQLC